MFYPQYNKQSALIKSINEQIESINEKKLTITDDGTFAENEFNDEDMTYMIALAKDELGDNSYCKLVGVDSIQADPNAEKYITATFAGYAENDENVIVFQFRKYITGSNYHNSGDIVQYLSWKSNTITKKDISN